jgi:ribosomal protein S18 acetylase RimI-like enzyme
MIDLRYYLTLARDAGVFKDIEIDILEETLQEWERRSDGSSTLVELSSNGRVSGFAFFGPLHNTELTYEVRWIVVDRLSRKLGIGKQLLDRVEEEILKIAPNAILSVEISKIKENAIQDHFFINSGFTLVGRIPNFYGENDDYLMYAKHIHEYYDEEDGEAPAEDGEKAPASEGS